MGQQLHELVFSELLGIIFIPLLYLLMNKWKQGRSACLLVLTIWTHTEQGSREAMSQDALLLSEYKLLQGVLQLLRCVTAANSSSVRCKLALLCFNPWNNFQAATCCALEHCQQPSCCSYPAFLIHTER